MHVFVLFFVAGCNSRAAIVQLRRMSSSDFCREKSYVVVPTAGHQKRGWENSRAEGDGAHTVIWRRRHFYVFHGIVVRGSVLSKHRGVAKWRSTPKQTHCCWLLCSNLRKKKKKRKNISRLESFAGHGCVVTQHQLRVAIRCCSSICEPRKQVACLLHHVTQFKANIKDPHQRHNSRRGQTPVQCQHWRSTPSVLTQFHGVRCWSRYLYTPQLKISGFPASHAICWGHRHCEIVGCSITPNKFKIDTGLVYTALRF